MFRSSVIIGLLLSVVYTSTKYRDYTGHSLLTILPNDKVQRINEFLDRLDVNDAELLEDDSVLDGFSTQLRLSPKVKSEFMTLLRDLDVNYVVDTDDLQKDFEEDGVLSRGKRTTIDFDLHSYHPIGEITEHLKHSCYYSQQPCEMFSIGKSFEGRDLNVIKIGEEGPYKGVIWLDGGIHAREWISPAMALVLLDKLMEKNAWTDSLLEDYVFYIMPNLNPDGYEYTHTHDRMWRKTRSINNGTHCRGTDPNRNWNIHWGGVGSSSSPCSNIYHGTKPFSESETRTVSEFLLPKKGRLVLFLSLHSKTQCWLVPYSWTYTEVPENYDDIVYVATKGAAAQKNATGLTYDIIKQGMRTHLESGESFDWAKAKAGATYAYILELRFKHKYGFKLPPRYIEPTGRETYAAFKAVLAAIRELER